MNNLLSLLSEIRNVEDKSSFNPLIAIGVGDKEPLHSRFIYELLNPEGSHRCGRTMLDLFLRMIGIDHFDSPIVSREKSANGRFIDIAIENKEQLVIIENKIWALDQPKQLYDYYQFGKNELGLIPTLIYLTPYGYKPSGESLCNINAKEVRCISYQKEIIDWLRMCQLECPNLATALEYYEELVRKVINRNVYMETILEKCFENTENAQAAINIYNALNGKNLLENSIILATIKRRLSAFLDDAEWIPVDECESDIYLEITEGERRLGNITIYGNYIDVERTPENKIASVNANAIQDDKLQAFIFDDEKLKKYMSEWIAKLKE